MNSHVKVVHMTTVHHPYDPRIYFKQCMSLYDAGYDVTLIAQQAEHEDGKQHPISHVPLKKYSSRWKRMIFGSFDLFKKAKKLHANMYVFHDPELLFVGWLLKRRNNIVIYDIHEDYVTSILQKKYLNAFVRKLFARMYRIVEKILTKNMELSLAEKYYQEMYPKGKCILNYPILEQNDFDKNLDNAPLENKLLYTGNVTEDRGALIQAEIPQINEHVEVHFVGKCTSKLANDMYEKAGNRKSHLTIEGIDRFIVKEQMVKTYASRRWLAGIALFPPTEHYMKKELTKFFEYMNVGLPIICSDFPSWKDFVEQHQCGIAVNPYNKEEINAAIEKLRNDPQLNEKMGNNGRKVVREKLNWKIEEQKLLEWYEQLIKDSVNK